MIEGLMNKQIDQKILYLPIETTARELESKLYLAAIAIINGFSVVLGRKKFTKKALEVFSSGFYISKDHKKYLKSEFKVNQNKVLFIEMHEEGFIRHDESTLFDGMPNNPEIYHDLFFLWGKYQKKIFNEKYPYLIDKSYVTGNPRFDVIVHGSNIFHDNDALNNKNNFLLIATNLSTFNRSSYYSESASDQSLRLISDNSLEKKKKHIKFQTDLFHKQKKMYENYVKTIESISQTFNLKILVRPHPSENIDNWKKSLKHLKNVYVSNYGNPQNLIKRALCLIHTGSTTGIESYYLKKPTILYNPIKNYPLVELTKNVSVVVNDEHKLIGSIRDVLSNKFEQNYTQNPSLSERLYNYNENNSSRRIIKILEKHSSPEALNKSNKFVAYKFYPAFAKYFLIYLLGMINLKPFAKIKGLLNKYPYINRKYVESYISNYIESEIKTSDFKKNLSIRRIAPDTFLIKRI